MSIENKVEELKTTKVEFLTSKQKEKIFQEISFIKHLKKASEKRLGKEWVISYQMDKINEVLNEVKVNSPEEEEYKKALEQNILRIVTKLVMNKNIDYYYEDIEELQKEIQRQNLEKFVKDNLTKHVEHNDRVKKQIEEKQKRKIEKLTKLQNGEIASDTEEQEEEIDDIYWMDGKPQELLKKIENGKISEVAIEVIEKGEEDSDIHLKAIGASEKMNKEIAKELRGEVEENLELLKSEREKNEKLIEEKLNLQKELEEQKELLKKAKGNIEKEKKEKEDLKKEVTEEKNKTKKWKEKFHLATKSLPKKPGKLKILKELKEKTKTKFQHLIEKTKYRSQELIAKIEIKVK